MQIEETLTKLYGPMLTVAQLAKVLDRSTKGLTISLLRADSDWARAINAAKLKIGRRVYFRTPDIARFLSGE
ncbi:DNA-binding protein [Ralstonia nicotianae]|uniref:DNA-binding protein n=1 Tax=Ralstonia pseudosolanacearum TaxID=1310165 RepID=UPI000E902EB0|nr:plasmid-related protein [Ralstonia solanacearum]